jgi:hypothetical protein
MVPALLLLFQRIIAFLKFSSRILSFGRQRLGEPLRLMPGFRGNPRRR